MSTDKKIWTYGQMKNKIRLDTDLNEEDPDEQFVTDDEMIGYMNEALNEAESEIMSLNQDYFLTSQAIPLEQGEDEYDLPSNIYLNKIRSIMYINGPIIYRVNKYKNYNKFEAVEFANLNGESDDYRHYLKNDSPGSQKLVLTPPSRETAIVPPLSDTFTPMKIWYIRNANRVPLTGEYTNKEDILPASVNTTTNVITVAPLVAYVTGDAVQFYLTGSNTLPSPLVIGTVYYVIALTATTIKLATSAVNAAAGTAIDLTTQGTNYFSMRVAATAAIIDATLIDIPDCSTFLMEWVKANCIYKDGDPRLEGTVAKLEQQRKMLQDSLAEAEPDGDDTLSGDFTPYMEMS